MTLRVIDITRDTTVGVAGALLGEVAFETFVGSSLIALAGKVTFMTAKKWNETVGRCAVAAALP
jgi:hypothetical protein